MKGQAVLSSRLQSLSRHAAEAAQIGGREAMHETVRYAKQVVPVRTGRLKSSIMPVEKESYMEVSVHCPYAVYVEMGTRFMSAQPYLLPGVHQADYFARVARAWKEAMK